MSLIDKDKMLGGDTFCEGIECAMCSLSYINDSDHCKDCRVSNWIREQPTIQAVPIEVLQDIRHEISDFEEDVFHEPNTDYRAYAAVRHCFDIVDKRIKEYTNEIDN